MRLVVRLWLVSFVLASTFLPASPAPVTQNVPSGESVNSSVDSPSMSTLMFEPTAIAYHDGPLGLAPGPVIAVEDVISRKFPTLPGMHLIDMPQDSGSQVIHLNLNGVDAVDYNGLITIRGIQVPPFVAPSELAGQEEEIVASMLCRLESIFAGSNVRFTTTLPAGSVLHSTIYIGGSGEAFAEYGDFRGLAESVDVGNKNPTDKAFVFSSILDAPDGDRNAYVEALVGVVAHETGRLLGYVDSHPDPDDGPLDAFADTFLSPYGSNRIHNLVVATGSSHKFEVDGIAMYKYTEWYVNGIHKETDDSGVFAIDPNYTWTFSSGATEIKALVYNSSWQYEEYHTWNVTACTTPGTPSLVSPSNGGCANPTGPILDWGSVSGATSYRVQLDDSSSFSSTLVDATTSSSDYQVPYTLAPVTWYWRVQAQNACGNGSWSAVWSFTAGTAPSAPGLVSPSNGATVQGTGVQLDWNSISGATSYQVQVDDSSSFSSTLVDATISSSDYQIPYSLSAGTTWYWRVRATNSCGTGSWSSAWSFTIGQSQSPYGTITNITASLANPQPGQTVTFAVTVRNDGTSGTVYVGGSVENYPASGQSCNTNWKSILLNAGASGTVNLSWVVPSDATGSYGFRACGWGSCTTGCAATPCYNDGCCSGQQHCLTEDNLFTVGQTPPGPGGCRNVEAVKVCAESFTETSSGIYVASGNVQIGDYLSIGGGGKATIDTVNLKLSGTGELVFAPLDISLFSGTFEVDVIYGILAPEANQAIVYLLDEIASFALDKSTLEFQADVLKGEIYGEGDIVLGSTENEGVHLAGLFTIAATGQVSGNFPEATANLAGCTLTAENLHLGNSELSAASAVLNMPSGLGSGTTTVTNLRITPNGISFDRADLGIDLPTIRVGSSPGFTLKSAKAKLTVEPTSYVFMANGLLQIRAPGNDQDIEIGFRLDSSKNVFARMSSLQLNLAGCSLILTEAHLNNGVISAKSASLTLPGGLGGSSGRIDDVFIYPDSRHIQIGSGEAWIKLPDIKVGGSNGFGLQGLQAHLQVEPGFYRFDGEGTFVLPNVGGAGCGIGIEFSLTSQGLEEACLTIRDCGKIPVANSGFFITGVQGCVRLDETSVTVSVKVWIEGGPTLPVVNRAAVTGELGAEINTEGSFTLSGSVDVIGFAGANASLSLKPVDHLRGTLHISMAGIVEGDARIHVWKDRSSLHITGSASVDITIPAEKIPFYWKDVHIGSAQVDFGEFCKDFAGSSTCPDSNRLYGIKGEVSVALVHGMVFVDHRGNIKWGDDVKRFLLVDQGQASSLRTQVGPDSEEIGITVPSGAREVAFYLTCVSGTPSLALRSPSGRLVDCSNAAFCDSTAGKQLLVLSQPEAGLWSILLSNVANSAGYQLQGYGNVAAANLLVTKPSSAEQPTNNRYAIQWNNPAQGTTAETTVSLYYDTDNSGADGRLIVAGLELQGASQSYSWDSNGVPSGQYYVYARIDDPTRSPVVSYSGGTVRVTNQMPPSAPTSVRGVRTATGIDITWAASPEIDVKYYSVHWGYAPGQYVATVDVGDVGGYTMDEASRSTGYYVTVTATDIDGLTSPGSSEVYIPADPLVWLRLPMVYKLNFPVPASSTPGPYPTSTPTPTATPGSGPLFTGYVRTQPGGPGVSGAWVTLRGKVGSEWKACAAGPTDASGHFSLKCSISSQAWRLVEGNPVGCISTGVDVPVYARALDFDTVEFQLPAGTLPGVTTFYDSCSADATTQP